uniref:NADH-ubiquinone oxidoreductase chain 4L n=1 Tax=Ctenolucius hujeta TaxID=303997 RepID=F7UIL4_9TELE|nr:NADH dehydrogenase subunit 4L [Ctenolucius hujeta]
MTITLFVYSTAFMLGLLGLTFHRTHLLSALLCLESMMLSLYVAFALWTFHVDSPAYSSTPVFLLAFSACEAGAGLALLVATTRTHGTDHLQNMNLLQC